MNQILHRFGAAISINVLIAGSSALGAAAGPAPVTVTVNTQAPGYQIPEDFCGVSIFTQTQARNHRDRPGNLFSPDNTQLITLFKNSGIHHLRLGATGSVTSDETNLDHADIDALFGFAQATGLKVIYSLHAADGPATARYVWDHYRANLDYFAFDNEPDGRLKEGNGTNDYFTSWRGFAQSVAAAVPGATFAGPDAAGRTLVPRFVKVEKSSGRLTLVTQHTYVGGNPRKRHVDLPHALENMLSPEWVGENYPQLYRGVLAPLAKEGLPFRITEWDDYVHGVTNASNAFASALWALDSLHWWAAHGAAGVNFQNTEWLYTDTFHPEATGNFQINPKAYGLKAFELGGRGEVKPVTLDNPDRQNLTAYAVGDGTNLWVTLINKEYGPAARTVGVTIVPTGLTAGSIALMTLTTPNNDAGALTGMTLGGGTITNNVPWQGQWIPAGRLANGQCQITVPPATADIVVIR